MASASPPSPSSPRHLLSFWDLADGEIELLIHRAEELRLLRRLGQPHATRPGKTLGMIFEKASTRTRVSFEVAIVELGGHAVNLSREGTQIGRGEPIRDTARVLSRYCHALMIRTFGQEQAEELARFSTVPVINGLTDLLHPCQVLADLQTVHQHFGDIRAVKYAWVGDGNNMANSWIEAAGILGLDLALAFPAGYEPDERVYQRARQTERGRITLMRDPKEAVAGRHVISTDVFTSMGQEDESEKRRKAFAAYCVDASLVAAADPKAIVLHCLPAHRGEEISEEVFEGPQSLVWQQAENRLHVQKALLERFLSP